MAAVTMATGHTTDLLSIQIDSPRSKVYV